MAERRRRRAGLIRRWRRVRERAQNAVELMRQGRLGAPYQAPFEVRLQDAVFKLRHYGSDAPTPAEHRARPVLFVPPLMVTSQIYDISPELSATAFVAAAGVDCWLVDFGSPEDQEGGLQRTLDDHIVAIDRCVAHVTEVTGQPVHLIGYSQGGMFCYQAAAYRKSADIASVITFGAPVDLRRNLPVKVHDTLAQRLLQAARTALSGPLEELQGLPGTFSSRGFKLLSPRQELKHLVQTLGLLHNREALVAREPKRRFLGGEGFIAWPGPAFRKFVDDFVINNRMSSGGFVIAGRTVTLADITVPILYFIGTRDDMARPSAVAAIEKAALNASCHRHEVAAGHFGLVVGTRAMTVSWPDTLAWLAWVDGVGERPAFLDAKPAAAPGEAAPAQTGPESSVQRLYDLATDVVDQLWHRLGEVGVDVSSVVSAMRWQLPRLARIESMRAHSRVSYARVLAEQADAIGDRTFFVWQGSAFSYAEADARVDQVVNALIHLGVRRGHHVGVLMDNQPDYLVLVAAINRLSAVSVLINTGARGVSLKHALAAGETDWLVSDPVHLARALDAFVDRKVVVMGRDAESPDSQLPEGVLDLDAIVSAAHEVSIDPGELDQGRASDLAMLLFTSGTTGMPKAARITNGRWVSAGLGAAAACELTPADTVYNCLPLYHATGMLVAVGGAVIGGARLALAPRFSVSTFWADVRNAGASVVFYVGEMCRYLVNAPSHPMDRRHPIRLFAGNGLRGDVWAEMTRRFGEVGILEFYSATEGNVVLVNRSGDKVGSVGREMTGQVPIALVRYDVARGEFERDVDGHLVRVGASEPGVLIARIDVDHPNARFAGYMDPEATEAKILRDVFEAADAWFDTGDLLRFDDDGDYYFVDRLGDTFRWKGENVSTEQVAQVLRSFTGVAAAAVYGVTVPEHEGRAGMAALELEPGANFDPQQAFDEVTQNLTDAARPRFIRLVESLDTTDSLKVIKHRLQAEGADPGRMGDALFHYDTAAGCYVRLDLDRYAQILEGGA